MSSKLLWTGLAMIMVADLIAGVPLALVGQILLIIGVILMWLDR